MTDKTPFAIAKETLRQLTERKLPPTALNYQKIYNEIAGIPSVSSFPADELREIAKALPAKTPGQQRQKAVLESAIDRMSWDAVRGALSAYGGFTPAEPAPASAVPVNVPGLTQEFFQQLARMIDFLQPALGREDERFVVQTQNLLAALRQVPPSVIDIKKLLAIYSDRLSFVAEDQLEIRKTLLRLLHSIFENMGDLVQDDQWLKGQMDALMAACAPPLSLRRLDELEHLLKDVIVKQKDAKGREIEAQEELQKMLATFIERLTGINQSTQNYHAKLEESAKQIEQAKSIVEIAPVLKEVVQATRSMAMDSDASREELQAMRDRTAATEAEIANLHQELDRISALARHDPLTGALNRKGLDETMAREVASAKRRDMPLCIAILDIDNFKKITESLGHGAGDEALAHLAAVAREVIRPHDHLARYGGEEFLIFLPDTPKEEGVTVLTHLQRELTKKFFLSGNEKVLITFSAGVVQLAADESSDDAIKRADEAMYLAKRAGKNRVVAA